VGRESWWNEVVIVAASLIFTGCWVLAGSLEVGYASRREFISALAAVDSGRPALMIVGFVALAVALVAASALIWRAGERTAALLLAGAGGSFLGCGLIRQECSTALDACIRRLSVEPVWNSTNLHGVFATLAFVLVLAALVVSARRAWRQRRMVLAVGGSLVSAAALVAVVGWNFQRGLAVGGFMQRAVISMLLGWMIVAVFVRRLTPVVVPQVVVELRARDDLDIEQVRVLGEERVDPVA